MKALRNSLIIAFIIVVLSAIMNLVMGYKMTWTNLGYSCYYNLSYGVPLYFVNGFFYDFLNTKITWEKNAIRKIFVGVLGSFVITLLTLICINYVLWVIIEGKDPSVLFSRSRRSFYIIALVITLLITAILHAVEFFREIKRQKLINEKLVEEKLKTELNALKAHIDPHFLFNSFNILYGLIEEDPKKAQQLLNQLSGIYRYILENRNEEFETLSSEIAFANKYLSLHQARFEDSIEIDLRIDDQKLNYKMPSLSLQLLLENAIKHNAFDEDQPLQIEIYTELNDLVVKNNKKPRKHIVDSNRMGLKNIEDRYALLGYENLSIVETDNSFMVKLPLINN